MITKNELWRIFQCIIFLNDGMSDIELNKYFNFKEMDFGKKILDVIKSD